MTIALLPHRVSAVSRLTRIRSAVRETVSTLPTRKAVPPTINAGRWATLPDEYAGVWACPLDARLPAMSAPGVTAPIACGNGGAVILHLAGAWGGRVAFEGNLAEHFSPFSRILD
ncbi:MAG: hypothetical protein LC748_11125 [Thermomicrobia bacterium]|nr:hypothetical protein [Thermomicrobia bacterium]